MICVEIYPPTTEKTRVLKATGLFVIYQASMFYMKLNVMYLLF